MATDTYRGVAGSRAIQEPGQSGLPLPAAADFTFVANPNHYDVFLTEDGPEILPVLARHLHATGLHGNDPRTGDPAGPLGRKASQGMVVIPKRTEATAFGDTGPGYSQAYETVQGEKHWCQVWKRPYVVGDTVRWEHDREGYYAFLRAVRDDLMPAIDPNVLRGIEDSLRRGLEVEELKGRERQAQIYRAKLAAFDDSPKKKGTSKKKAA